eukprot:CAMPEP_0171750446 /NCGR_PEP_ID=MMETSP0991-20121206/41395_1 /TAXON_ID=483369 /ORGANISM="non described non described, Strain CCMP2098" /LENGTH=323 /DNA_ID=CAMNT_0012351379 /DNA_START=66 /DNA_END=1034 /DNA_ORIENTATION=+
MLELSVVATRTSVITHKPINELSVQHSGSLSRKSLRGVSKQASKNAAPTSKFAAYWSQYHLRIKTPNINVNKVAVIVTGQLRFKSEKHLVSVETSLQGTSCFVVTYNEFRYLAQRLSSNFIIVAPSELEDERTRLDLELVPGTAWQWYLLSRALDHWKSALNEFDTIVRFRTDLRLYPEFRLLNCVGRVDSEGVGIVYAASDIFFYSTADHFIRLFGKSMYSLVASQYMEPHPNKPQTEALKKAIREYGGVEYSCLLGKNYAPVPRIRGLHLDEHATAVINTERMAKMERNFLSFKKTYGSDYIHSRRSLLSSGPSRYTKEIW